MPTGSPSSPSITRWRRRPVCRRACRRRPIGTAYAPSSTWRRSRRAAAPRWPRRSTGPASCSPPSPAEGRDRVLVLITDGQVGNEDQILRTLGERLKGIRVFTLGIDRAVNEAFLRRLAEQGRGSCELVESEDRLDEVMTAVHRRIGTP